MPLEKHPLSQEFPEYQSLTEYQSLIQQLKEEDTDFAAMLSEYHELDRKVFRFEQHNQPISDHSLENMKYRRVNLKNRLYQRLKTHLASY